MILLSLIVILLIIALTASEFFKRRFEECLAPSCFLIIFILYCFGLVDLLALGFYFILIVCFACLFYFVYTLYKKRKFVHLLTPGIITFFLFIVFLWWTHRTRILMQWDEFSHWGLVVKNIYIFDSFHYSDSVTTLFPGYPPAVSLFQYFALKLGTAFTENTLYRCFAILNFSMLLPIMKKYSWKDWKSISLIGSIMFLLPLCFFRDFYHSIYVDGLLGVTFFYVVSLSLYEQKHDLFYYLCLFLSISFLVLAKSSGAGIAVIALLIQLCFILSEKEALIKKKKCFGFFITLLALIFAKYSWDIFLQFTNTPIAWESISSLSLENLIAFFKQAGLPYQYKTLEYFFIALFTYTINDASIHLSYFGYLLVFIALVLLLLRFLDKAHRRKLGHLAIILVIGAIVYQLSLLVLYLFTYSEHEAVNLASFTRYSSTYLLGMFLIFISYFIHSSNNKKMHLPSAITLVILLFFNINTLINITIKAPAICGGDLEFREQYKYLEKIKINLNPEQDKVYFISMHDSGYDIAIARYLLTPIHVVKIPWSIGEAQKEDIWTVDFSIEELTESLIFSEATHLYIHNYNDSFAIKYSALFEKANEIKTEQLYQIYYQDGYIVFIEVNLP